MEKMEVQQYGMYLIRNIMQYPVLNDKVSDKNNFGDERITREQLYLVYADIGGMINEIERVHPKACLEVRTGFIVGSYAKKSEDKENEEMFVQLKAYRYHEYDETYYDETYDEDVTSLVNKTPPDYMRPIGEKESVPDLTRAIRESGGVFMVYDCKHIDHSPEFECGPWFGSLANICYIKTEDGKEGERRKKKLEEICGFK